MSSNINLLDCTLRDGAYIVDGQFGERAIAGILSKLQNANVDIIECGWLKDADYDIGTTYFHKPEDIARYIPSKRDNTIYVAMVDWNRYDLSQLTQYDGTSIDAIRIVFPKSNYKKAIPLAYEVKKKGYQVFLQAANTLGYADDELISMIREVNVVKPDGLSIVDTFGAMYEEDLIRISTIIDHNLDPSIMLGLHSHNNLQQSFSLAMSFIRKFAASERRIVVDGSLVGMGRGAGNACTELLVGYLNKQYDGHYDLDVIMDAIDLYMTYFTNNYSWGYSVPFFISGMYCAHVNNIAYLKKSHRTPNADIKAVLEAMPAEKRLEYDYDYLENTYIKCKNMYIDDEESIKRLSVRISKSKVIIIAPGKNIANLIIDSEFKKSVKICVNFIPESIPYDYIFFTNSMRLKYAMEMYEEKLRDSNVILTSNLMEHNEKMKADYLINYNRVTKRGWVHFDNSVLMCLRLLSDIGINEVEIAGFDGYSKNGNDYTDHMLKSDLNSKEIDLLNLEIVEMMDDFLETHTNFRIKMITDSVYDFSNCRVERKIDRS